MSEQSGSGLRDHLGLGIAYMLAATLSFSIADAMGKLLTERYPFMEIIWLRSVFGVLLIAVAILATGDLSRFGSRRPGWHLARSLVGILLTTGIFTGLKFIPLAEVTAVVFATPLIVAVYSSLVLREHISTGSFVAISLGFVGVLLVVRPTPDHFHFAHLFMLGFACASAFLIISARKLAGSESVLTLNFYIYPATLLFSSFWAFDEWVMPDLLDWGLFFGVSLFATIALFCVTKAMQSARPAQVAPFDYARIIWTVILGYLFWGEFPDLLTWSGILVIVTCGIYIIRRGRMSPEPGTAQPVREADGVLRQEAPERV